MPTEQDPAEYVSPAAVVLCVMLTACPLLYECYHAAPDGGAEWGSLSEHSCQFLLPVQLKVTAPVNLISATANAADDL